MTTGENIRCFRKQRGLTQNKLAELSGIHPVSIRKYETNKMHPQLPQLRRLAATLGVNLHDLFESEPSDYTASALLIQLEKELEAYRRLGTVEELAELIKAKEEGRILYSLAQSSD